MSVEALDTRADEKILPEVKRSVEIFFGCLFYPWGYVFANKVNERRRPIYLVSLVGEFPTFPSIPHFL